MNESKKRGRPSKAEIAAREAATHHNGDESREPEDVLPMKGVVVVKDEMPTPAHWIPRDVKIAQAYAERVWAGQSDSVPRNERLRRVAKALEGQGLSMEGVILP